MTFEDTFMKGKDAMAQGKFVDACLNFNKAIELLERKAVDAGPGSKARQKDLALEGSIRARLGHCHRLSGKFEESRKEFERVRVLAEELRDDRLRGEAQVGFGYVAWRSDDHKGARQHFNMAIELANKVHDKYLRGMAKMGIGNLALVVRALNEGVKTYEEARSDLENVPEARTDHARLLHNLAFLYYKKGDNAKALELYKKTLSISDSIGEVHTSGFTYENMAMMFVSMGKLAEAEESIEKGGRLLARSNDRIGLNLVVWVRGLLKAKNGTLEEALELYRKAKRGFEDLGMHVQVLNMTDDYVPVFKETGRKKEALDTLAELRTAFAKMDIPELVERVEEVERLLR
jgi:tetratricopeptide (TPR) repeat protein